jgi:hypothetical protein
MYLVPSIYMLAFVDSSCSHFNLKKKVDSKNLTQTRNVAKKQRERERKRERERERREEKHFFKSVQIFLEFNFP